MYDGVHEQSQARAPASFRRKEGHSAFWWLMHQSIFVLLVAMSLIWEDFPRRHRTSPMPQVVESGQRGGSPFLEVSNLRRRRWVQ
jgi:H+/Cl- antiporter ClcA